MGHLGTLDPIADGVLPVAVGQATRLVEFLVDDVKGYLAEMTLGGISDTQDAWGNITYLSTDTGCELSRLMEILQSFRGEIEQVPPMYSALNYQGERLYRLARQGITVELTPRSVMIHSLELVESLLDNPPYRVILKVVCSKGTYIRTLCHDIGQRLGCGAYLSSLTRLFSGSFRLEQATELSQIEEFLNRGDHSLLLPLDYPLAFIPSVVLRCQDDIRRIKNGNTIDMEPGIEPGLVRIYSPTGELLALGSSTAGAEKRSELRPVKVFNLQ